MKTIHTLLAVLFCCAAVRAADGDPAIKLTGIAQLGTRTVVLVEAQAIRGGILRPVLAAGEKVDFFEIVAINPKTAKATVKFMDRTVEMPMGSAVTTDEAPTLHFKDADSRQVLEVYQELSGRTLLFSPVLPSAKISLQSKQALNKAASLEVLEAALREKGIIVTPRYDKFVFVTPVSQVPRLAQIPEPPVAAKDDKIEKFPAGLLMFSDADLSAILDIYQELSGRTVLASPDLPPTKISLRTQTKLTRDEAVWLLDAAMYLATVKMVPEWTKFTYALPATRDVKAPKIADNPAADKLKESKRSLAPGSIKFSQATTLQALALYAELLGRQPLTNASTPAVRFTMTSQTALHPVEAIYALDALAELNRLRFVLVGDKQVKIVPISAAGKTAGSN